MAISGKRRVWLEIQNLYLRFVSLKVRIPPLCTYRVYPFTLKCVCLYHRVDQPGKSLITENQRLQILHLVFCPSCKSFL